MSRYVNIFIVFVFFSITIFLLYKSVLIPENFYYYLKFIILLLTIKISILYFIVIKKNFTKEFPLFFFSFVFTIYIAEYLSYFYLRETITDYYKEDLFNYYELNKKKNKNLTIFNKVIIKSESGDPIVPLSGLAKKETILCNENGYFAKYISDRYGFRNKDEAWDTDFNWVILGNSFAHGSCVNDEETIHHYLQKYLNNFIINLGIVGNDGYHQLGSYREFLINNNPRNIIWFYFEGNDFRLSHDSKYSRITKKYLKENFTQNLVKNNDHINRELEIDFNNKIDLYKSKRKIEIIKLTNLRLILNKVFPSFNFVKNKAHLIYKTQPTEIDLIELKKVIDAIKKLTNQNMQNLYFVYIPSFQRYHNKDRINDETYFEKKKIIKILKGDKYNVIDLHKEFFSKLSNPLDYFPYKDRKGHYTAEGYKAVASIIYKKILNNDIN